MDMEKIATLPIFAARAGKAFCQKRHDAVTAFEAAFSAAIKTVLPRASAHVGSWGKIVAAIRKAEKDGATVGTEITIVGDGEEKFSRAYQRKATTFVTSKVKIIRTPRTWAVVSVERHDGWTNKGCWISVDQPK
jgi:hypothetical protein